MSRNLTQLGVITQAGSDVGQFHTQQASYLGKTTDLMIVSPYGLHGNAAPNSLALIFSMLGKRLGIPWVPKGRPKMAAGEVAFYHPPTNSLIAWRAGGKLEITTDSDATVTCANLTATCENITADCANLTVTASGSITATAPTFTINANLAVNGTILANGVDIGELHKHSQSNDSAGNSQANTSGVI